MKRLFVIMVIMLTALTPSLSVSAAMTEDGIAYQKVNDTIIIVGFDAIGNTLNIPESIEGLPVTEIGPQAFRGSNAIVTAIIPSGVTKIGKSAFEDCQALTTVKIHGQVTEILDSTFRDCRHLKNISLPNSLVTIEGNAFYGCSRLGKLEIPSSVHEIGQDAFIGCERLIIKAEDGTVAAKYAEENSIPTKFSETPSYTMLLAVISAVPLGLAVFAVKMLMQKAAKRKKSK